MVQYEVFVTNANLFQFNPTFRMPNGMVILIVLLIWSEL